MVQNKKVVFAEIPTGFPEPGKHTKVVTEDIDLEAVKLGNGEVLVKLICISLDPYQRPRMRDASIKSYMPAFPLGQPLTNFAVAKVIRAGEGAKVKTGEVVYGMEIEAATYSVVKGHLAAGLEPLDTSSGFPLTWYVGVLGMPGQTALAGIRTVMDTPRKDGAFFVSAASGAVGQIVGQLAKKHFGTRVIGSAGSDEKVEYLHKLGFDAAFNYKTQDTATELQKFAPDGIEYYFDNVGGPTLDAVLDKSAKNAKIALCGAISEYNTERNAIKNMGNAVGRTLRLEGFLWFDAYPPVKEEFWNTVPQMLEKGEMLYKEDVTVGLENLGEALLGMLQGKNKGKAVIWADEETKYEAYQQKA